MSKIRIINSAAFLHKRIIPLQRRQPNGEMNKRQAQAVTLAALRPLSKPIMINGNLVNRRGFETVFDEIIERKTIFCLVCGTVNDEKTEKCKLCENKTDFIQNVSKFDLICVQCDKPFYLKNKPLPLQGKIEFLSRQKPLKISRDANGNKIKIQQTDKDIAKTDYESKLFSWQESKCNCFQLLKEKRRQNLTWKRQGERAERNKRQAAKVRIETAQKRLNEILAMDKSKFSRELKRKLSKEKVELIRFISNIQGIEYR